MLHSVFKLGQNDPDTMFWHCQSNSFICVIVQYSYVFILMVYLLKNILLNSLHEIICFNLISGGS